MIMLPICVRVCRERTLKESEDKTKCTHNGRVTSAFRKDLLSLSLSSPILSACEAQNVVSFRGRQHSSKYLFKYLVFNAEPTAQFTS